MPLKVFLIAGEHSGDTLGSGLIGELKEKVPDIQLSGIGGPLMESHEGFESLLPMDELCVMGLWEVIGQLPRLLKLMEGVIAEIEKFDPDVVVTIDLPDFNFLVGHRLKKRGKSKARLVHYVAPSVWAWRPGRAKMVAQFLDGLMCLFPHEPPYFTKHNLKTEFVGHPLIEHDPEETNGAAFRDTFGIPQDAPVLALFFGSRDSELDKHADVLKETAAVLQEEYPNLHVIVPTLPHLEYEAMKIIYGVPYPAFVLVNPDEKWDEFAACNVAVAVSGTVGLELAYMGVPHVIAYKMHPLSWLLVKILVKTKYAHLANILLNEAVVPEYLQGKCNSIEITKGVLKLFKDDAERQAQLTKTRKLRELLTAGPDKSPSERAADFVIEISKGRAKELPKKEANAATKALASAKIPEKLKQAAKAVPKKKPTNPKDKSAA
jgi:lipid-A-disaccharide synthase